MITGIFAVFSGFCASMQSAFTKLASSHSGKDGAYSFNTCKVGVAVLLLAILSLGNLGMHIPTMMYASCYGVSLLLATIFGYLALMKGSMALTALIASYSVVLPCIFGFVALGEPPTPLKLSGLILLLLSMYMLKKKDSNSEFKKGWLPCIAITFVCNGLSSIIQKLHQTSYPGMYLGEFTLCGFGYTLIFFFAVALLKRQKITPKATALSVPSGIAMGLMNYLTLALASKLDATVLFPMVTVFTALFNFTVSTIFFKERFTKMQIAGIVLGIVSVIFIK